MRGIDLQRGFRVSPARGEVSRLRKFCGRRAHDTGWTLLEEVDEEELEDDEELEEAECVVTSCVCPAVLEEEEEEEEED